MKPPKIVSTVAQWLLPTNSAFDLLRILVVSAGIALFFLFVGQFSVLHGTSEYSNWAYALVTGQDLRQIPSLTWRDVGYPLIILLSLYPWTLSLIGLAILKTRFAIAIPILAYLALRPWFPKAAFYAAMAMTLSLSSFLMMKSIHHDQPYTFLLVFTAWLFNKQVRQSRPVHLYGLTVSVFAMSLVRLIGKSIFPFLLMSLLLFSRKHFRHFAIAALAFFLAQAAYSQYRGTTLGHMPPIWGAQLFHNVYLHMEEYGVSLSPDMGPNTKLLIEKTQAALLPSPAQSIAVADTSSAEFREQHFFKYSADELLHRLLSNPNKEYWSFLVRRVEVEDHVLVGVSIEMLKAHPIYVLRFVSANAFKLLSDPGYRYDDRAVGPLIKEGIHFPFGEIAGLGLGNNEHRCRDVPSSKI